MAKCVGVSGSLRKKSYNSALLRIASGRMPAGSVLELHGIADIPLYNEDLESSEGIPPAVARLKRAIIDADGLLFASPEYNNSLPGVLKNAIDWLSRPPSDIPRVFGGKPVAIIGATPGGFGTILAQDAWLAVFRHLGARVWFGGRLLVSHAHKLVDDEGVVIDAKTLEQLDRFLQGFVGAIDASRQ